jgi:hypothetical protein
VHIISVRVSMYLNSVRICVYLISVHVLLLISPNNMCWTRAWTIAPKIYIQIRECIAYLVAIPHKYLLPVKQKWPSWPLVQKCLYFTICFCFSTFRRIEYINDSSLTTTIYFCVWTTSETWHSRSNILFLLQYRSVYSIVCDINFILLFNITGYILMRAVVVAMVW